MSQSARLAAPPAEVVHGYPCSVGKLRSELPADEQDGLDRLLASGRTAWEVFEEITEDGHTVAPYMIGKHRRKQCRCFTRASA